MTPRTRPFFHILRTNNLSIKIFVGDIGPSQSSQGLMALTVMLVLLCLVITYCCWGTCCKLIRKRRSRNRRSRSQVSFDSSGSCASDSRLMMWSRHSDIYSHHSELCSGCDHHLNHSIIKPRLVRTELPPPPYETLFSQEINCAPPSYSSLALNQRVFTLNANCDYDVSLVSPGSLLAVEREVDPTEAQNSLAQETRVLRCQSVPTAIHTAILFGPES